MSENEAVAPVLLVEDSALQAEMLRQTVANAGYEVMVANNGAEALALAARRRPVAVVSDVNMPIMGGYELCRRLRELPSLADVPVILLTSLTDTEDVILGLNAGADYYVTKPYDEELLLACVSAQREPPCRRDDGALTVRVDGSVYEVMPRSQHQLVNLLVSTYESAVMQNRELRRMQESLLESNRTLERAYGELRETQAHLVQSAKMASLGELVAGIAHEINNPLAFVVNHHATVSRALDQIEPTVKPHLPPEQGRLLAKARERQNDMADGLGRIRDLVLKLRTFSRLDAGEIRTIDIEEAIESVLTLLRHRLGGRIRVSRDFGQRRLVECYPGPLNQVLMNLLANAIDAIAGEGAIDIVTREDGDSMRIEIADTGEGMSEATRERIFEPFFTTKAVGDGTGLGLSISFGIVRQHGGTIEVFSTEGEGTRIVVRLPLRQDKSKPAIPTRAIR